MRFGLLLCLIPLFALAETVVVDIGPDDKIVVQNRDDAIKVDGELDEAVWAQLPAYDEFVVIEPDTLAATPHATRVRLFYSDRGLYVGIDMDQPQESLTPRLSSRDNRGINRDSINITLDTSGEGRYGYWFGIGLGDSLMDGTLLPERQFSSDWDGAWYGASHETETGWSGEFFIPWGTMSMPQAGDTRRIGMYMSRKVAYLDERWGWPGLPSTVPKFISELQTLEVSGVAPKQQYSVYPFVAAGDDRIDDDTNYRVGADVFWRPSTNFQMTATLNPDFGIVESDDVVINLTATETFFPEKRLFFLEGQEVFVASPRADTRGGGVGNSGAPTTMVNTRRIGGRPVEPVVAGASFREKDLVQPVELMGAVKVTGQSGRFRYGLLSAFEDEVGIEGTSAGLPIKIKAQGSNYGVARLVYEDNPGGGYRAFGLLSTAVLHDDRDAVAHGLDAHYLTPDGKLKVDGQVFMSDIDGVENGLGGFLDFEYTIRQGVSQRLGIEYQDETVDINDLGFLQRNDSFRIRSAHVRTNSDLTWARDNQFDVRGFIQKNNSEDLFTGGGVFFSNRTTFKNLTRVTARVSFLPKSYDDLNSFGNGTYRIDERTMLSLGWNSNPTRKFIYGVNAGRNSENLGGMQTVYGANLSWRPTDRFNMGVKVTYLQRDGWLLHQENANFTTFEAEQWAPRFNLDYFINAKQQLRASLQWVGIKAKEDEFFLIPGSPGSLIPTPKPAGPSDDFSFSQLSFQLRYRWEIAPLSDIFVVYTRVADRGAALRSNQFSDVFSDAWDEPITDILVFKLRYRFGS